MNQGVVVIDCEADGIVSSPNSTVSSVSGKRSAERDENDGYRAVSSSLEADDDAAARKKLRLSKEQATVLEATFKEHHTLDQVEWLFVEIVFLLGNVCIHLGVYLFVRRGEKWNWGNS